jgi:bacterioferritin
MKDHVHTKKVKLPSLYLDSKLFHRPCRDDRDTSNIGGHNKSVPDSIPDPQLEPLEPDEDQMTDTQKAIRLLKAEPDTTGRLEGKFKVSLSEMIRQLNRIVSAEYSQWFRWYHYSLVLRGHCRNALAEEFENHAEEELGHAEAVAMRIIGLGGDPTTDIEQPIHLQETEEILKELLFREQKGMQLYREVHALCGDNEGTRQVLEGNISQEQDHIDELWRFLKNPEMIKGRPTGMVDHSAEADKHLVEQNRMLREAEAHKDQWNMRGYARANRAANSHAQARELHLAAVKDPTKRDAAISATERAYSHGLRASEVSKAGAAQESGESWMPKPQKQRKREYDSSFYRDSQPGISGGAGPDLPDRGRDWHGTVPGVPDEPGAEGSRIQDQLDRPPVNLVDDEPDAKKVLSQKNAEAKKALAAAPRFSPGPFIAPREKEFLRTKGWSDEDLESGEKLMTPRLRAEFNRWLTSTVRKSIGRLAR